MLVYDVLLFELKKNTVMKLLPPFTETYHMGVQIFRRVKIF